MVAVTMYVEASHMTSSGFHALHNTLHVALQRMFADWWCSIYHPSTYTRLLHIRAIQPPRATSTHPTALHHHVNTRARAHTHTHVYRCTGTLHTYTDADTDEDTDIQTNTDTNTEPDAHRET